ncbi:MAG: FAD-dependent monooxygenase, partial [Stellaceae bacterium]
MRYPLHRGAALPRSRRQGAGDGPRALRFPRLAAVSGATHETPVLIVGGGPVGLALAADLGWRGIACILVEQGDGRIDHPRANT